MEKEAQIINELHDLLEHTLECHLPKNGKIDCANEITRIRGCLNQINIKPSFLRRNFILEDIESCLTHMIKRIDMEVHKLETICGGVKHYSSYIDNCLSRMNTKVVLRNCLYTMLNTLYKAQPNLIGKSDISIHQ